MEHNVEYYPLTYPQRGIWYTEKMYPDTSIGIIAATLKIRGNINYDILDKAINLVIKKNDSFRTGIKEIDGEPCQYVMPYEYKKIELIDFSGEDIEKMYDWDTAQAQTPLDIKNNELCKFYLLKISDDFGGFFIKIHHTLADAWSIILFGNQTINFYDDLMNSRPIDESEFPSYIEYVKSEQSYIGSERYFKDRQFWIEKLAQLPEISSLKNINENTFDLKAKRKSFTLPVKLCKKINSYCHESKTSILTLFLCALSLYINRVTDKKDIIIGTPVLNRSNFREKETIGMFINTIPIRINIDDDITFEEFSGNISKTVLQSLKHQKYSMDHLLNDIREMHKGIDKLFDICLSYQNAKFIKGEFFESQEGRWHFTGNQRESLYIHINEREGDGELVLNYDYRPDLFYAKEIDFLHDHMIRLLWHALDNPSRELPSIEMVSEKEKNKILYDFNSTKADFPISRTISSIFEEQVKLTPNNTALVFRDEQMTYSELNKRVNKLAGFLRRNNVGPDTIVGLISYRSFEMVIGILAILKAGGAYMPIDPEYPEERMTYMLENSKASVLLISSSCRRDIAYSGKIIYTDDIEIEKEASENIEIINKPGDLAYVIYTSGSTGRPKGAMVEHHSVINRLNWMRKEYKLSEGDRLIQKTPFTFDVSVWELMLWFFCGAGLVILDPRAEKDPSRIIETINKNNVSVIHFVPSMLNTFLDHIDNNAGSIKMLEGLRLTFASGEALLPSQVEKFNRILFRTNGTRLHNLYGPTEATVDVSYHACSTEEKVKVVPIGRPIDNISLYILDKHQNIMPIGAVGELYISGEGLARGYINNPELTDQKFIMNPYADGERMYKTGDLARWFPDGEIEYLGRIDQQVKIRGFRIELGEIQAELLKIPSIHNAIVVCRDEGNGNKALCAYIVFKESDTVSNIKKHLYARLPGYMIPAYFVEIKEIPLSENGKLNSRLLPDPLIYAMKDMAYVTPRNEAEKNMQEAWESVLNINDVGIKDNFFDIGGDSLKAMNLVSRLGDQVSIEDIYKHPTIELLTEYMSNRTIDDSPVVLLGDNAAKADTALVCFPYGGADSFVYNELNNSINKMNIPCDVFSVKRREPGIGIAEYAEIISRKICDSMSAVLLYGHCVGSALALETARNLEKTGFPVKALIIGGNYPPVITRILNKTIDPWTFQTDNNIIKFFKLLGLEVEDGSMTKEVIKNFREDVKKYYEYFKDINSEPINKLNTKIICITGEKDILTNNFQFRYKNWYKYSKAVFQYNIKGAKHYFIHTHSDEIADIVSEIIGAGGKYEANSV